VNEKVRDSGVETDVVKLSPSILAAIFGESPTVAAAMDRLRAGVKRLEKQTQRI
jgi:hypothetical protein